MDRTLQMLVVSADESLETELRATVEESTTQRSVVRSERAPLRGCEVARDRQPDVIVIGMEQGSEGTRSLAAALAEAAPRAVLLVAYRHDELDGRGGDELLGMLRANARDFLRRPLSSGELFDVLQRLLGPGRSEGEHRGHIISFVGNKGGVGKSTLAGNTACMLASGRPDRVLLVDASIQLGVCSSMFNMTPEATLSDAARQFDRLDGALLRNLAEPHPSGVRLLAAPRDAVDAAVVDERALSRVLSVGRSEFDVVVVDTFPMLDAVAMSILDLSDRVYAVFTGLVPNVLGMQHLVEVLERLSIPSERIRLVLNQTHPSFPGQLAPADVADRLARTIDHVVPYSRSVPVSMNTGRPAALAAWRFSRLARAFRGVSAEVEQLLLAGEETARRGAKEAFDVKAGRQHDVPARAAINGPSSEAGP
ncbi:MAG: pilus assembly protein CpaE [Pseudohongiellaceae bacterium]|jgi:pilus assembly protein CpaE